MDLTDSGESPASGVHASFGFRAEGATATVIAIGISLLLVASVGYMIYKKFKKLN